MPITSNNGVWTNLVLKINATPSQKQRKSLLRFRIRYLRFSRSTASKKECPPNLWKVKSLRISCQNDMSRLCNHHKPTNRWKSISLYRDTNTHTHINQFTHTHTTDLDSWDEGPTLRSFCFDHIGYRRLSAIKSGPRHFLPNLERKGLHLGEFGVHSTDFWFFWTWISHECLF